jgi:thioredoxin 1
MAHLSGSIICLRRCRATAALAACTAVAMTLLGCGGAKVTPLSSEAEFDATIRSPQPVLVDFYKGGCPTCVALDGTMDKLADEYRGRAIVAKFELMKPYFAVTSPELKKRYDISFFPTAVLFVNGQEVKRWVIHYEIKDYRQGLNEALATSRPPPANRP